MPKDNFKKIAVWNSAFLGDAILTLPLLQSLRLNYPEARIDFYTRRGFSGLFSAHPALDAVYEYDKASAGKSPAATLAYGRDLAARGYDLWISAHRSLRSAMLARSSGARVRIGYDSPSFLGLNRLFYTRRVPRRFAELQEVERLLELLRPLDLPQISTWPDLALPEAALAGARNFFAALEAFAPGAGAGGPRPVLGLHPGSVWGTKRWPVEYFAETGLRALRAGAQLLLFAGPGEEGMAADVFSRLCEGLHAELAPEAEDAALAALLRAVPGGAPVMKAGPEATRVFRLRGAGAGQTEAMAGGPACVNLAGALNLPELAAFIGRLSCYVSNDSGPMHMAWPQRVPLVALFGPTVPGLGFAPRGENSILLETDLDCRPCGLHGPQSCPKGHHDCMRRLNPDLVWPEVKRRL
ncbi:glycosyltransferase family 9 protein [Desulfovibrio sp. OttesenSCG-928-C14]|nr:glycosyltransferase family 9 protein [Desulfovibrio sp. OttesenSCG-928-C14]